MYDGDFNAAVKAEGTPRRNPPIDDASGQIVKQIALLTEIVDSLEQRLAPIIAPGESPTGDADKLQPVRATSPHVSRLHEMADGLGSLRARLSALLDVLDV